MSKVSILTAVYNSERHLRKCLDSLVNQTLRDIQIICIDDHSTDSSLSILQEYASNDSRIVVLEQSENQGQAVARNRGLEIADGEYITMLDSDDWFGVDALEKLYNSFETYPEADCALFKLMMCYPIEGSDEFRVEEFTNRTTHKLLDGKDAFLLSLDFSIHGLYMVRSDLHKRYPYDTSCRTYSDDNTSHLHYLHSRQVVFSDGEYFYNKHDDSITTKPSLNRFDFMYANLSMKRQLLDEQRNGVFPDRKEFDGILNFYETYRWLNIIDTYYFYFTHKEMFSIEDRKSIKRRFRDMLYTIEPRRISWHLHLKPGYIPFKRWWLFKGQEEGYFRLRRIIFRD